MPWTIPNLTSKRVSDRLKVFENVDAAELKEKGN
jgi:hypothetical protein